ncbi:MAG: PKD domain-containing protein [Reichenbachiella sp.]
MPDRTTVSTKTDFITVSEPIPPIADFTSDFVTTGKIDEGGTVTFTDASLNVPTSWSWEFEGGTPATSTEQNPVVTYNTGGIYEVTLTASNAHGNDAKTLTDYIFVSTPGEICDDSPTNLIACGNYNGESDDISAWLGSTLDASSTFDQMDHLGISSALPSAPNGSDNAVYFEKLEGNGLSQFAGAQFTVTEEASYTFSADLYAESIAESDGGNPVVEMTIMVAGSNDSNPYRGWQAPGDTKDKWGTKSVTKTLAVGTYVVGFRHYGSHARWHYDNLTVVKD